MKCSLLESLFSPTGLTLFHPRLPVPTNNYTFVHLDISTLEPQPGFASIRESMINGKSGCQLLNSTQILSRGNTLHGGVTTFVIPSNYCWRPVSISVHILVTLEPLSNMGLTYYLYKLKNVLFQR